MPRRQGVDILWVPMFRRLAAQRNLWSELRDAEFTAPVLVVATGGLTIPKMGATDFGYQVARQFGIKIRETRPALTPLLLNSRDRSNYCDLAGVSTEVIASSDGHSFREAMLITHQGLSGPAILQISSYWQKNSLLKIDLAPEREVFGAMPPIVYEKCGGKALSSSIGATQSFGDPLA